MNLRHLTMKALPLCIGLGFAAVDCAPAAAQAARPVQLAIGSPLPNSLIGGRITLAVSYDAGATRIKAYTVYVDDTIQFSRNYLQSRPRGVQYLELETRSIPDGAHVIRVVAVGETGIAGQDSVPVVIRNGSAGALDLVPPLLHFRNLIDGDITAGKILVDLLAEDNRSTDLLVSVFVNRSPHLITNRRPYSFELDTAEFLDPATGTGQVTLEAFAFDSAGNKGAAPPVNLQVRVAPPVNQTPLQAPPAPAAQALAPEKPMAARGPEPLRIAGAGVLAETPAGSPARPPRVAPDQPAGLPSDAPVPAPAPAAAAAGAPLPSSARLSPPAAARTLPAPRRLDAPASGGLVLRLSPAGSAASAPRSAVPEMPAAAAPPAVKPAHAAPKTAVASAKPAPAAAKPAPAPSTRMARAEAAPVRVTPEKPAPAAGAANPLVIVPDPGAKPDEAGRIKGTVYELLPAPAATASLKPLEKAKLPQDRLHRVKPGETVPSLARRYRVTPRSLMVANGLGSPSELRTGARLKVPGTFQVAYNHSKINFDVPPRVENGLPLAPFRQIFEHTGGVVVWYHDTKQVRAAAEGSEIKLQIGSKEALVNQMVIVMDREAFIDSGRTLVPISFVKKALNLTAEYDVRTGTIHLVRR